MEKIKIVGSMKEAREFSEAQLTPAINEDDCRKDIELKTEFHRTEVYRLQAKIKILNEGIDKIEDGGLRTMIREKIYKLNKRKNKHIIKLIFLHEEIKDFPKFEIPIMGVSFKESWSFTPKQEEIIRHALGIGRKGQPVRRSYFVTSEGSDDFEECENLVKMGAMERHKREFIPGYLYFVTSEIVNLFNKGKVK